MGKPGDNFKCGAKKNRLRKARNPDDVAAKNDETLLVGNVSDLLEEVKKILRIIKTHRKTKQEGIKLFQSLFLHYYPLIGINYKEVISLFIYDTGKNQFNITFNISEIRSWWP